MIDPFSKIDALTFIFIFNISYTHLTKTSALVNIFVQAIYLVYINDIIRL